MIPVFYSICVAFQVLVGFMFGGDVVDYPRSQESKRGKVSA